MRHLRRLTALVVPVAAVLALWWTGLKGLAVIVTLVCGLGALLYLIGDRSDGRSTLERKGGDRVQRNIPPPS